MPKATSFVPTIWSARALQALDKSLVYAQLFNRDYEGEIKNVGDTVKIGTIGDPTIKDYTVESEIDAAERVAVTDQTLTIDQAKYYNIAVDDVLALQSNLPLLDEAATRAGLKLSDVCDQYLAGVLAAAGTANTDLGTNESAVEIASSGAAYDLLVHMNRNLSKANLAKAGRTVVVSPEFEAMMLLDSRFVAVGSSASDAALADGVVYKAAGFTILVSNNVPVDTNGYQKIIATSNIQGTFAQQILKTEAYRPEKGFSDAIKGLHVYGAKTLRPECVAVATVSFL